MNDHSTRGGRLAGRFRRRSIRDMQDLDARGRLGEPPRPWSLAVSTFVLVLLLGLATFSIGRVDQFTPILLIATVGVAALAIAVGFAVAMTQYQSTQQLDQARAEMLGLHSEIDLAQQEAEARLHDARATTAAMGAALHALGSTGADAQIAAALSDQLAHLQDILAAAPTVELEAVSGEDLCAPARSLATLHGLELEIDVPPDLSVMANRVKARQIVQNIVDNARKYAPASTIKVTCEPAGPYVRVVFDDDGPGVARQEETAIFMPGVRSGADVQGFGMGLAVVRRLAEEMRGALWYEQRPGGGSRFVLKLLREGVTAPEGPREAP